MSDMNLKSLIREVFIFFHLDYSRNIRYDRHTRRIMKAWLKPASNCIDIGCHKGEILTLILKYAPNGQHFAFEPLPHLFDSLKKVFGHACTVLPFALSDKSGNDCFQFVKNAPAYSGLKKRRYDIQQPEIQEIQVKLELLDHLIPAETNIDFIKIDVEGGEFGVLKGGQQTISRCKPLIIFECGLGASDYYGTRPEEIFEFVSSCGLGISLLHTWPDTGSVLSLDAFVKIFNTNSEYYFVAWKTGK